jgi:hypothetical protein
MRLESDCSTLCVAPALNVNQHTREGSRRRSSLVPALRTAPTWQCQVRNGRSFIGRVEHVLLGGRELAGGVADHDDP